MQITLTMASRLAGDPLLMALAVAPDQGVVQFRVAPVETADRAEA